MSKKQYLKALNKEIQELNQVIDLKIITEHNYRREARRHKKLLAEVRRQEVRRSFFDLSRMLTFS